MKGLSKIFLIAVLVVITGCQRSSPLTANADQKPRPLLMAKDGSLVSGDCMKDVGNVDSCTFVATKQAAQEAQEARSGRRSGSGLRGWTGSYSTWWAAAYYLLLLDSSIYQYYRPNTYRDNSYRNYWGWGSDWYAWLGWTSSSINSYNSGNTNSSTNYGSCGTCITYFGTSYCQSSCVTTVSVSYTTPTPVPTPVADPCRGLAGSYSGACYADGGGSSSISISVASNGSSCTATSGYFQPATVYATYGSGTASVSQVPGGVAITNTSLQLYGNGRFAMTGYNYAGNFFFSCRN